MMARHDIGEAVKSHGRKISESRAFWMDKYSVRGSKGNYYTVTLRLDLELLFDASHCTCPAYKYSSDSHCKHIAKVVALQNPEPEGGNTNEC